MKPKHFSQNKYGKKFCGPTCIAMVLDYFGRRKNPREVFSLIKRVRREKKINLGEMRKGYSYFEEHVLLFKKMGLKVEKIRKFDFKEIKRKLDKKRLIILRIKSFRRKKKAHFVVVKGYEEEKLLINDPQSRYRKPQTFSSLKKRGLTDFEYVGIGVSK